MVSESKTLHDGLDKPLRILFFMDCPSCKKRLGIYNNGQEYVSKPFLCPKCNKEANYTHKSKGNITIWKTECSSCGYTNTEIDDWNKNKVDRKKEKQRQLVP